MELLGPNGAAIWDGAKAFLNSNFVTALLGAGAGAWAGAWAAQKIAERTKEAEGLRTFQTG